MRAKSFNLSISQDMSALWNVYPVEFENYLTGANFISLGWSKFLSSPTQRRPRRPGAWPSKTGRPPQKGRAEHGYADELSCLISG